MPLDIENRGNGFIGEIGTNWRISQNGSPLTLGDSPGRLGSLSFSASCDATSKFTIDNYLSVKHFFDNNIDRWLSTFDGYVRSVDTDGKTGRFTMASLLSSLNVERTSSVDVSGTYQQAFTIPAGTEYTILSTTYTIGGYWTSIGSENVFVPRPTTIWDVTSESDFIYVLVEGQHGGEVVIIFGIDGEFYDLWPVYSDATDLANPSSRYISYADSYVYIGQVAADRVKKFVAGTGAFVLQFGSAGTGDGQFNTISGIAANGYGLNAVYVTDSVLGRIQVFTEAGAYNFQWGTSGTGAGNSVFNAPNGISIDPITDDVFISDRNARVRAYSSGSSFVAQVMGSYDFTSNTSTGEFLAGANYIKTAFDHLGNAYAIQNGKVWKYARANAGWAASTGKPIREWDVGTTDFDVPNMFTITDNTGIMHVAKSEDKIIQYAASLGKLQSYFLYYVALAAPDFPAKIFVLNNPWATGELAYISWTGNVWDQLCQMCAATGNAMVLFDDQLYFINRSSRWFRLPDDVQIDPIQYESRSAGQAIEIVNQNSRYTNGQEVIYLARSDNQRTFNVAVGSLTYVLVEQNTYPEFVNDPQPNTIMADGKYVVVDRNLLVVDPTTWTNYGGAIRADVGEKPGTILLTLVGPGQEIPGYESPYKIATASESPSLSVTGAGVVANPELITIGTGVSESVTSRKIAVSIDSPFAFDATTAWDEGTWAAYNSGTPNQRVQFTMRVDKTNNWIGTGNTRAGTFQFIGIQILHDNAIYVVEDLDYNATTITISCYRYTRTGWNSGETGAGIAPLHEEIWAGKTADEFDAYWAGHTAQDYTIAPLMNPYGV